MKNKRTWMLIMLSFLSTINYLDCVILSVSVKPISTEFGLSPVQLGYMFSSFLWLYVIFLVPMGMIVDRFGPQVVNAAGIGVWSLATISTGFAGGFGSLIATRIAMGLASRRPILPATASFASGSRRASAALRCRSSIAVPISDQQWGPW